MDAIDTDSFQTTEVPPQAKDLRNRGDEMTTLCATFDTEVRPLIDLIDRLRGFGLDRDINLPAVAVIGDQSAGKSSVLEAISGVQLPRGTGIVTRCPLEMCMKHAEDEGKWEGMISYTDIRGKRQDIPISEPESVGALVQKAQNEMTDHKKGISEELITLKVTSSDVPDLTLIDLPGIARNAVEGQPDDIESRIKAMIRKYIQRQETVILVVLQCNVDIATCEALKMAKEFDNNGTRTLGVLTKPDLLDRGTESEVMRILSNKVFPLSKGYVVVKCRGQENIAQGQSLKEAMKNEDDFFNRQFCALRPSQWGICTLSRRLSQELKTHIKALLPDLKNEVRSKLLDTEEQLSQLGPDLPQTAIEKKHMALMMVTNFITILSTITHGHQCEDPDIPTEANELFSQTRDFFSKLQNEATRYQPDIEDRTLRKQLGTKMKSSRGREFTNYMGKYELVENFAREYIKKMEIPALKCFDDVMDKTTDVLKRLATFYFHKMPDLASKAEETILKIRSTTRRDGKGEIRRYLHMETLIYSQDLTYSCELEKEEHFKKEREELPKPAAPPTGVFNFGAASSSPTMFIGTGMTGYPNLTRDHENGVDRSILSLKSYYQIAARRLCDMVPMIIQQHIFREQVDELQKQLMDVASDEKIIEYIQEGEDVAYMKKECKSRLERLQMAELEFDKL